ncbi:MAG: tellurite resistance TerB family protein [Rhodospirillales bacterium]|nr:tellurite resistance TerB family protein [Rhodospirillales bacterium]MBN8906669.1 tellurite resistance TerB family protein [Rhodospirillales bacterium]
MRLRDKLDAPEALVLTMVLVAAADGGITDREIGVMSGQVQTLPAFHHFRSEQFEQVTDAAVNLLREEDGLNHAARLIRDALTGRLRETAYALACEVVAAHGKAGQETIAMLDFVQSELHLDALIAAAIGRGVRARYQRVDSVH